MSINGFIVNGQTTRYNYAALDNIPPFTEMAPDGFTESTRNINNVKNGQYAINGYDNTVAGTDKNYGMSEPISVVPGERYTLSFPGIEIQSGDSVLMTVLQINSYGAKTRMAYSNISPRTITVDQSTYELQIFVASELYPLILEEPYGIQIEEGSSKTAYIRAYSAVDGIARENLNNLRSYVDRKYPLMVSDYVLISAGSDANELRTPGVYIVPSQSVSKKIYNLPHFTSAGVIRVSHQHIANEVLQVYTTCDKNGVKEFQRVVRNEYASPWCKTKSYELADDAYSSRGVVNVVRNSSILTDVMFATVGTLPMLPDNASQGDIVKGIPYSSAKLYDKFVGLNVSVYSFLTAVYNPRSVLYTEQLNPNKNAKTYYGCVCSSFVSAVLGLKYPIYAEQIFENGTAFEEVNDINDLQIGDMDSTVSHVRLVTGITRNQWGDIVSVEISEAVRPSCRTISYFFDEFVTQMSEAGHKLKRYLGLSGVSSIDYTVPTAYADICTNYGDKVLIKSSDPITLNVLNAGEYTAIHLFKNGSKIAEYSVADRSLGTLGPGNYEAKLYGASGYVSGQSTLFSVCSATVQKSNGRITFSDVTNCTPIYVQYCDSDGGANETIELTASDVENGYVADSYSGSYSMVKLGASSNYGSVGFVVG